MRMLAVTVALGQLPGEDWPQHLGGVLHGFVERAVLNHAPRWLEHLRPAGKNGLAGFTIHAPPPGPLPDAVLRFGLVLFGALGQAVDDIGQALARQCAQRLHGRAARLLNIEVVPVPGWGPPLGPDESALASGLAHQRRALHTLVLRSPLLLASRGAAREGLKVHGELPWPSLGSVLDSVAQRISQLEPALVAALQLSPGWRASAEQRAVQPLTPAADPARQVAWTYSATPRHHAGPATGSAERRHLPLPGIIGTLIYPATGDPLEAALLHWGQWTGVGQKTTMGCGSYVWRGT